MRKPQRKRLTRQQKKLVTAVVTDPNQTLDELGQASGYSDAAHVNRALKAPAVVSALERVRGLMEQREKLSLGALLTKLEEGLEATEVKSLKLEGSAMKVEAEVVDFAVRRQYMRDALELHGAVPKKEDSAAPTGPINIAIVLGGGGSDIEKSAVADAILGSRLSRGLHPLENRPLTPAEQESYRRTP